MAKVETKHLSEALELAKMLIESVDEQLKRLESQKPDFQAEVNYVEVLKPLEKGGSCR